MSDKEKRSRRFRIIIDIVLSAVFIALLAWLKFAKDYDGAWVKALYFAIILSVSKLLYDVRLYNRSLGAKKNGRIRRLVKKIFRPILAKFEKKKEEKKKYLKGYTERQFVFRYGRNDKKPRYNSRIRANLKKCRTNSEKLRMMYIRGVLKLRDRGCDVTPSKTPGELEKMLSKDDNKVLFHTYARMRYEKDFSVDDKMLAECEDNK